MFLVCEQSRWWFSTRLWCACVKRLEGNGQIEIESADNESEKQSIGQSQSSWIADFKISMENLGRSQQADRVGKGIGKFDEIIMEKF